MTRGWTFGRGFGEHALCWQPWRSTLSIRSEIAAGNYSNKRAVWRFRKRLFAAGQARTTLNEARSATLQAGLSIRFSAKSNGALSRAQFVPDAPCNRGHSWPDMVFLLTDVSEMLGIPVHTLYRWRYKGDGPVGYRVGRHVRYRREAVEAWLEQQADQRQ
jgi:excisionase family DNA binding protein